MSDCVVRFGGDNCNNLAFIGELADFLNKKNGLRFVVVSSITKIYQVVSESLDRIFLSGGKTVIQAGILEDIFTETTGEPATSEYKELVNQLTQLLYGISMAGDYSKALEGVIISFCEKLSAHIFQYRLKQFLPARIILPEDFDFRVLPEYGNATFLSFGITKLRNLSSETIYIIPGSYGITETGKIARAGYSASDYSAAALTASLDGSELTLWGLENDFFSADPKLVDNPAKIGRLTYSEASELAYFDHYSLHPRTVEPLEEKHIPIYIVGNNSSRIETVINSETFISERIVKGIAYTDDISLLKLEGPGVGLKPGILARVTTLLSEAGINVKSVITSQVSINFILSRNEATRALSHIEQLGLSSVREISVIREVSLIGIVGYGMQQNYGVSARLFAAVAENKINVLLSGSGASDLVSYLVVKKSDRNKSIREIYRAFFNQPKETNQTSGCLSLSDISLTGKN